MLSCAECATTVTIDTATERWHDRLSMFATGHADHMQTVLPVPEPHEAAS